MRQAAKYGWAQAASRRGDSTRTLRVAEPTGPVGQDARIPERNTEVVSRVAGSTSRPNDVARQSLCLGALSRLAEHCAQRWNPRSWHRFSGQCNSLTRGAAGS